MGGGITNAGGGISHLFDMFEFETVDCIDAGGWDWLGCFVSGKQGGGGISLVSSFDALFVFGCMAVAGGTVDELVSRVCCCCCLVTVIASN